MLEIPGDRAKAHHQLVLGHYDLEFAVDFILVRARIFLQRQRRPGPLDALFLTFLLRLLSDFLGALADFEELGAPVARGKRQIGVKDAIHQSARQTAAVQIGEDDQPQFFLGEHGDQGAHAVDVAGVLHDLLAAVILQEPAESVA